MAIANQNPSNISIAKSVTFTTTDLSTSNQFIEPHVVFGPSGSFTQLLNDVVISGNKIAIPLTTNTSEGASYLKLHLPQPNSSTFYVTYAIKNSSYEDGYYDYLTGIPDAYRTDLRTFILDGVTTLPAFEKPFYKSLVFSAYGLDSNKISESIEYKVTFSALFGTPLSSAPVSLTP